MIKSFITFLLIFLLIFVVVIGGVLWLGSSIDHHRCRNNVQEMGREYRYDLINGCRVGLDDGTFIYWELYREVNK